MSLVGLAILGTLPAEMAADLRVRRALRLAWLAGRAAQRADDADRGAVLDVVEPFAPRNPIPPDVQLERRLEEWYGEDQVRPHFAGGSVEPW